jgi:hypothetical protein
MFYSSARDGARERFTQVNCSKDRDSGRLLEIAINTEGD